MLINRPDSLTIQDSVIKSLENKTLYDHCEDGNEDACIVIVEESKANGFHEKALDFSIKSCLNNNKLGCDFITNEALEKNKNLFKENKPALAAITIACTDTTFTVSTESCEKLGNWYLLENNPHFAKKVFARLHFPEFRKSLSIVKLGLIYHEEGYDDLPCILYYIACDLGLNEGCEKLNLCKIDNGFVRVKVTENKNHDNEKKSKLEKSKHIFDIISQSKNKTSLHEDELLNKIYQIEQISKASSFFLFLTSL